MQFYYMFRKTTQIGPLNADEFLQHVDNGRLKDDTPVSSPEYTGSQWVVFGGMDLTPIKQAAEPLRQQRLAKKNSEQQRLQREQARQEELQRQRAEAQQRELQERQRNAQERQQAAEQQAVMAAAHQARKFSPHSFPALEIYKTILYVIAIGLWCLAVLVVAGSFIIILLVDVTLGVAMVTSSIGAVLVLFLWGVGFAFLGQLITVFTSIETNTHEAAFYSRLMYADRSQGRKDLG